LLCAEERPGRELRAGPGAQRESWQEVLELSELRGPGKELSLSSLRGPLSSELGASLGWCVGLTRRGSVLLSCEELSAPETFTLCLQLSSLRAEAELSAEAERCAPERLSAVLLRG